MAPRSAPTWLSTASSAASCVVLVRPGDLGRRDLVDLEPQQVDRARERRGPRQARRAGRRWPQARAGRRVDRLEVDPGEAVEGVALGRLREQGLVGVLAVQVDEVVPDLRQQRHRRHATVD